MTDEELRRAVEAVLLVAVEPVPARLLAELLEEPADRVEAACDELAGNYLEEGRGFVLARIAGGFRYQTHPDQAPY
ncbi:MAG TPA: SMC-Scp complex subunit ScpB, partial [Acidimicrobiales bacterium]|nr:SMC-Scp complex subunit ScpB [Acidimicrobiales bacterium]